MFLAEQGGIELCLGPRCWGALSLLGTLGLIGPYVMETEPLTPPTCAWTFQVSWMPLASLRGREGRIALVPLCVLRFLWRALSQTGGVQSSA